MNHDGRKALPAETREDKTRRRVTSSNASERSGRASSISTLHRSMGNQVVQGLVKSGKLRPESVVSSPDDEFGRFAESHRQALRELGIPDGEVNSPDDQREVEAERFADRVTRKEPRVDDRTPRKRSSYSVGGGAQALPARIRTFFEGEASRDLSDLQVHTGARAARLSARLGARAFTVGNEIYMGAGEYRPESKRGLHLLAHEVGHALQRSEGELRRQAAPGEARSSDVAAAEEGASPRYEPGEVERSRSDEGIHDVDVHEDVVGGATTLLIADFGVGQSDIKSSTKEESLLKQWLERFAGSSNYQLAVEGSTDSVGSAATNSRLKQLRAQSFLELLDPSTRSRTTVVSSGPGVFGFSNDTPEGRAANRSVIVQVKSSVEMEGEPVEGERRSPGQIIEHARSVYRSEGSHADEDWTMYGSLTMLLQPGTDDRYIDGWLWQSYGANVAKGSVKSLRNEVIDAVNPNASNSENMREIMGLSRQIESGICYALSANRLSAGGGSALSSCHRDIIEWMKRQTENSNSIYHTWKDARVDPRCASLEIDTPC